MGLDRPDLPGPDPDRPDLAGPDPGRPGPAVSVGFDSLRRWGIAVLEAAGASPEAAAPTADACIDANRRGFDSHGIAYLSVYLPRLRDGLIDGTATPEVVEERPSLALIDGHFGAGALIGRFAMTWCCERAEDNGIAAAVSRNSSHFGAASYYSELAAANGCLGIVVSNSDPGLAPAGSLAPILGTNPLAIAGPSDGAVTPSLDMATSAVAQGRLVVAARRNEPIPLGWAIGRDGQPTTDPLEALDNALLPAGGHKGFGLAFMIDVLTACLGAGTISPELVGEKGSAQLFIAIKVGAVASRADYDERVARLVDAVHRAPRADGAPPFLVPGERAASTTASRSTTLELDARTVELLRALGAEWGVPFPLNPEATA